jgi:hypothetical protein
MFLVGRHLLESSLKIRRWLRKEQLTMAIRDTVEEQEWKSTVNFDLTKIKNYWDTCFYPYDSPKKGQNSNGIWYGLKIDGEKFNLNGVITTIIDYSQILGFSEIKESNWRDIAWRIKFYQWLCEESPIYNDDGENINDGFVSDHDVYTYIGLKILQVKWIPKEEWTKKAKSMLVQHQKDFIGTGDLF